MAVYNEQAFDFARFEPAPAGQAIPKKKEKLREIPHLVEKPQKNKAEIIAEMNETRRQTLKVLSVLIVLLSFVGMLIYSRVRLDEVTIKTNDLRQELSMAESENVRMSMELNSKVTLDKVEKYATEQLGMVKLESYQIKYVDISEGNKTILSGNKVVGVDDQKTTFKQMLAYIF